VPSYVPTNGLVGWWPFNGNANDESGNGNNGTVNGASLTGDRNGLNYAAYYFNGSSNMVISKPFFNNGWTEYTINFWANISIINPKENTFLNTFPHCGVSLGFNYSGNNRFAHFKGVDPINNSVPCWSIYSQDLFNYNSWNTNQWIMITISKLNNTYAYYINGQTDKISNATNNPLTGICSFYFGSSSAGNGSEFINGKLDDIGIWNRALTQQEITDLYNGCSSNGIALQPANVSASNGTNAQFTVNSVLGATYQWQTDLGLGFQNLSNAGQYSGVSSNILTVSNVSNTNNNQQFRCIASNGSCSDTSNVAVLTVSTSGISELDNQNNLKVFPNPSTSHFEIQTNLNYNLVEIRDMQGRLVKTENKNKVINVSSFQKGTYLIRLLDEKSKVIAVQRIIKE
jgi:hypothetical protein